MRILILGLGSIGHRHFKNFKALGVDDLIGYDPQEKRIDIFNKETGAKATNSLKKAYETFPDLVVVASPNNFHLDQAIEAAKRGCHLFIEKPLSITNDGIDELEFLVDQKGLYAHVGSNWKFHPAFIKMKEIINGRQLGKITSTQIIAGQWLPDWHPWEDYRQMYSAKRELGGGIVFDSHDFDYLTWLLGFPTDVLGMTAMSTALDINTEDIAVACLRLPDNVLATIQVDYLQREYRRRYHISGTNGTLEWDYSQGCIKIYDALSKSHSTFDVHLNDINDMYLEQSKHILESIKSGKPPITPIATARKVLEILLKVKLKDE